VLLLTGATGTIGRPLLRRLTAAGVPVRCLVRDPRRLGAERVRVQIALGDLADPRSFRHALRGVDTVVHLASVIRDQPAGSIEELAGMATWRLVRAAEAAGAERFVFFSALGATTRSRARMMRAKAIAERAVVESSLSHTVFAPSAAYTPGDPFLTLLERMSLLPVMPISGSGRAAFQPMWAEDVADCVVAVLPRPGGTRGGEAAGARYELAGPETLAYEEMVRLALRSFGRRRHLVHIPIPVVRRLLRLVELLTGPAAFATWDEVELLEESLTTPRGTADAERLGVSPRSMREVLGVS
jgi:NADH dehydrogenase